jgi:LysM repeat protein
MRWRAFALISLGINLLLAALWLLSARHHALSPSGIAASIGLSQNTDKPKVIVRRQFFSWQELESADYPTYIANLRDIGCPEQTIRDIVIADVNSLYSRIRATNIVTPEQQWWRSDIDTNILQTALEKGRAMDDERRALLTRLLGSNWEAGDIVSLPRPSRTGLVLDGPVLGSLPQETKQSLQEVSSRSQDRLQTFLNAARAEGRTPSPSELARLRQQTRDELAKVLTPPQLEEFLLRYSQEANNLRSDLGELAYFNATPDEFRALFRATDTLDQRIQLLDGSDPNSVQGRAALDQERENAIRSVLGAKRYEQYQLLQDPLYRDAFATAQKAGIPDAVQSLYEINLAAAAEQEDIQYDTTLTPEQKAISLKQLELQQLQANAVATGQSPPPDATTTSSSSSQQTPPRRTLVVRSGDTASVISMIYGLPLSALQSANPGVDLNHLRPGAVLVIPPNPLPPPRTP